MNVSSPDSNCVNGLKPSVLQVLGPFYIHTEQTSSPVRMRVILRRRERGGAGKTAEHQDPDVRVDDGGETGQQRPMWRIRNWWHGAILVGGESSAHSAFDLRADRRHNQTAQPRDIHALLVRLPTVTPTRPELIHFMCVPLFVFSPLGVPWVLHPLLAMVASTGTQLDNSNFLNHRPARLHRYQCA